MNIKRRRTIGSVISLSSMADIAFLLLVFFVVTSAIGKKHDRGIKPPRAESLKKLPRDLEFTLLMTPDGILRFQGRSLSPGALTALVKSREKAGRSISRVQISGDRGCSYGQLAPYLQILKQNGVKEVIFAAVFKKAGK